MRIGIISDTHGFLDPRVAEIFSGVEHILHAGDVGSPAVLLELERIAPVTAVLGNTDTLATCNLTEVVMLAGRKFLLQHIVDVRSPEEQLRLRIAREQPDAVVFGHTHRALHETRGGVLYLNPGYAGRPRFNQPRSVAVLEADSQELRPTFCPL
ncbi:MAG: metallophosphoesterase family protein [Verrucomicrobia bacterium]|nr:metallophosphoesterase family protein [Verrucomicrobiota bacterium]